MATEKIRIGDLLLKEKLITPEQLQVALGIQKESNEKILEILVKTGALDQNVALQFLAKTLQIELIDLPHYPITEKITRRLPENLARRFQAILLEEDPNTCIVGMVDPLDIFAVDELKRSLGKQIKIALINKKDLSRTLDLIYRRTSEITNFAEKLDTELKQAIELGEEQKIKDTDTAVAHLVDSLLKDAIQVGASDIHIEPGENVLRVRLRVDGMLQEQIIESNEKHIANALAQRLKLLANLNIAEKRLPQDGGFDTTVSGMNVDFRLSTMPTQFGESIVMRILNQSANVANLDTVGMPNEMLARFRQLIKLPRGLILVTGPTGSGKTTTLYGALAEINDITKNIITIEDPVEYRFERLNQVQVNPQLGLSFAKVLRAAMRQDPNIILVGEIRDQETAEIAARAALTGHLVFATLHTNDAASTALRLIDIGVEGYLVASTIRAVLSQRLMRRVCESCVRDSQPTDQETMYFSEYFKNKMKNVKFKSGAGCSNCSFTGYKGRIGVYELLEFDTEMLDALRRNDSVAFVNVVTKNRKTATLLENAFEIAASGISTLSEVLRVAGELR